MLGRFGFRRKMLYLCISEEERAHRFGVFSSFLVRKKVVLHYELVISTLRRNFFLGVCGFSLRNVDGFFADVERNYSAIIALCLLIWIHTLLTDYNPV